MGRSLAKVCAAALVWAAGCGGDKGDTGGASTTRGAGASATAGTTDEPTTGDEATGSTTSAVTSATTGSTTGGGGKFCQESCVKDSDCTIIGVDEGYSCVGGLCTWDEDPYVCRDSEVCDALFSGWAVACASQAECPRGQVCVTVEGEGRCAVEPDGFGCEQLGMEEVTATTIEGLPVTVCGETGTVCVRGRCEDRCKSDAECFAESPHCNLETGECECQSDAECALFGIPAFSRCSGGFCGCGADADCTLTNTDACQGGFCGCSGDAACTSKGFDGTMIGCG